MEQVVYSERYNEIINNAKTRGLTRKSAKKQGLYVEQHHIIPKCIAPELEKDKKNLVFLTAAEHFEVHKELSLSNPNNKSLTWAWFVMCEKTTPISNSRTYYVSPTDYETARVNASNAIKGNGNNNKSGEQNSFFGKHHNEKTKELISNATSKPIVHIESGTILKSACAAVSWAKENNFIHVCRSCINKCCNGKADSASKDKNGIKQHWRFATEYEIELFNNGVININ